jgi:membrane-associated HD superfamily phosphohydrolase
MESFRQSGNFNAWEAASAELARFEETNQLRFEDVVEFPEELNQMQETFLQQRHSVMESCEDEKRKVYHHYLSQLETLKSDLTKQGQMNAASTVNQVIRALQTKPRYLALERGTDTTGAKKSSNEDLLESPTSQPAEIQE